MKYRITLNKHNCQILVDKFDANPDFLVREYWLKQLMQNEKEVLRILGSRFGARDPQQRLIRSANRMLRRYVRTITGLPRMNGSNERKRIYEKFFKQHNFTIGE